MKVIIAGSRTIHRPEHVEMAILRAEFPIGELVCGMAPGVDMVGYQWANNRKIPIKMFPAQWRDASGALDKAAGMRRNAEMAAYADALIAVYDGFSKGTANMIKAARNRGLLVYVHIPQSTNQGSL